MDVASLERRGVMELARLERRSVPYLIERKALFADGTVLRDVGATSQKPGAKILWEGWQITGSWPKASHTLQDVIAVEESQGWKCVKRHDGPVVIARPRGDRKHPSGRNLKPKGEMSVKVTFQGIEMEFEDTADAKKVLEGLKGARVIDRSVRNRAAVVAEIAAGRASGKPRRGLRVPIHHGQHRILARAGALAAWPLWLATLKVVVQGNGLPVSTKEIKKGVGYRATGANGRYSFMPGTVRGIHAAAKAANWDGEPLVKLATMTPSDRGYRRNGGTCYIAGKSAGVFLARMEKKLGLG